MSFLALVSFVEIAMLDTAMLPAGDWRPPSSLLDLIQQGPDAWQRMRELVDRARARQPDIRSAEIRWHAPIPRPGKNVFCLGRNYVAHAEEAARARGQEVKIPTIPVIFTKAPTSVTGPFDDIAGRSRGHAAGGLGSRAGRGHRKDGAQHLAERTRCSTSSATRSSTTSARATCSSSTCSGSRGRASTGSARWALSS